MSVCKRKFSSLSNSDQYIQTDICDYFKIKITKTVSDNKNFKLLTDSSSSMKKVELPMNLPDYNNFLQNEVQKERATKRSELETAKTSNLLTDSVTNQQASDIISISSGDEENVFVTPSQKNGKKRNTNENSRQKTKRSKRLPNKNLNPEKSKRNPTTFIRINRPSQLPSLGDNLIPSLIPSSSRNNSKETNDTTKKSISRGISVLDISVLQTPKIKPRFLSPKNSPEKKENLFKKELKKGRKPFNHDMMETEEESLWNPLSLTILKRITDFVSSHIHLSSLLSRAEQHKLHQFINIEDDKYKFYCFKLFTRRQKWNNIFKFRDMIKVEMSDHDVKCMYYFLEKNGFIISDYKKDSCINLLQELLVKDIKEISKVLKVKATGLKKVVLIHNLLKCCTQQTTLISVSFEDVLRDEIVKKMGICVKMDPDMYRLLEKVHLLYSFVRSDIQTISELYLYLSRIHLKEIFMPKYRIDTSSAIFSSIEGFLRFSTAYQYRRDIEDCFNRKHYKQMLDICEQSFKYLTHTKNEKPKNPCFNRFTAGNQYTSTLSFGVKHLGRFYPENVEIFLKFLVKQQRYYLHLRGTWYDLLIMIQDKYLKQHEAAGETLVDALEDRIVGRSDIDLQTLSFRGERMKSWKTRPLPELLHNQISFSQAKLLDDFPSIEIDAQVVHDNTGGKRQYIEKTDQEQRILTVEDVALNHYKEVGYEYGAHCEGKLFETLFFILFWDIIYNGNIPGAFIHDIQYFPLDLRSEHFYLNRRYEINRRLEDIKCGWPTDQLKMFMSDVWDTHSHEMFSKIDSLVNNAEELFDIVMCIGRLKLGRFLERIAKDYRSYHSGLPDLFVWSPNEKKCKYVEVKGENDKLSSKQKVWLNFLRTTGANVEVCHVHSIGSRYKPTAMRKSIKGE